MSGSQFTGPSVGEPLQDHHELCIHVVRSVQRDNLDLRAVQTFFALVAARQRAAWLAAGLL